MSNQPIKNQQFIFYASLSSQSTGQWQANPTLAAGDVKVATDDGAPANIGTLPVVDADFTKRIKVTLSASEMNGDNVTVIFSDAAGAEWDDMTISVQPLSWLDTNDDLTDPRLANLDATISSRSSHAAADIWSVATRLLTAGTNIVLAKGAGVTGFNDLSAGDVRTAVGLASANLDTQLDALPTAAENADAVWDELKSGHTTPDSFGDYLDDEITSRATSADVPTAAVIADAVLDEDMTAHQTQGSLGQAIGDPVADTNTIYKAVVTDAAGATVGVDVIAVKAETASIQSDTNDIQTRIPAALSGDGFIKADLKSVDDELTNGNNATLNLKKLNVVNNSGDALVAKSTGGGGIGFLAEGDSDNFAEGFKARGYLGIYADGTGISGGNGFLIQGNDIGLVIESSSGKSINAPQDIAVSDGDLTLTNIAKKVLTLDWTTVTGEAARSVLNALRKLRNRVYRDGANLKTTEEDDTTVAYTQPIVTDPDQEPFKEVG